MQHSKLKDKKEKEKGHKKKDDKETIPIFNRTKTEGQGFMVDENYS